MFLKQMEQGVLEDGEGYTLTVCQLEVTVPRDLARALNVRRDQALGAVSVLVALLDERVAQELLVEDLILYDQAGVEAVAVVDQVTRVRKFPATTTIVQEHEDAIATLAELNLGADDPRLAAGRWYLRAAQGGPTPDAVPFLWIALDALSKPRYGTRLTNEEKRRPDVKWVEMALQEAGVDPSTSSPTSADCWPTSRRRARRG